MRACAATANEEAEKVLAAYPPDRVRGKADSLRRIREALEKRTKFEDMLQAVKIYATESEGFTWSKVCFSDNWFKSKRWRAYVEEIAKKDEETNAKRAKLLEGLAGWVTDCHSLCHHITLARPTHCLPQSW